MEMKRMKKGTENGDLRKRETAEEGRERERDSAERVQGKRDNGNPG